MLNYDESYYYEKDIKTAIFWVVTHYGKFDVSCCLYVKKCQNEGIIVLLKM